MPCTSSDHRRSTALLLGCLAWLASGCSFVTAPGAPRQAMTVQSLGLAVAEVPSPELLTLQETAPGHFSGTLSAPGETVAFALCTHARRSNRARPLVLLVPILAGGDDLMQKVALRLQAQRLRRGVLRARRRRPEGATARPRTRRTVPPHGAAPAPAARLAARRWHPAPHGTFVLGMSLGGMVATVGRRAQEPDLAGIAICLSGGDLKELIGTSSEPRVQRWRDWRQHEDGLGADELRTELEQYLTHEPLRYAPAVPTERVLLVAATMDTVVPERNQLLLWEALGRPARYSVPLGHYSAALAIDAIVAQVARHFDTRQAVVGLGK
jgi:hypothetical protein